MRNLTLSETLKLADDILADGIGADGLSGTVDTGGPAVNGGSPYSGRDEDQLKIPESDVLAYSGSGPTTVVDPQAPLPWNGGGRGGRRKRVVRESEGYFQGHPTDATLTGVIQVLILDNVNLKVLAPSRILESVEAYKFFEQFQQLLPRTPMLNAHVMESIASWWRNFAVEGDLLEINCSSGQTRVINQFTHNVYALGCLGNGPTYPGPVA